MDAPSTVISTNTQKLVGLISMCCADVQRQPIDLRYNVFQKWLKETRGATAEDLSEVREFIASVGGFTSLRNSFFASAPSAGFIEAVEMKSIARLGKVATTALANDELVLKRFEDRFSAMLKAHATYKPFGYAFKKHGSHSPPARVLNLALSDLHFGTWLDPREVPYRYDFVCESRRLASIIKRVCEFKRDYRDETELVVWLGGDLMAGLIHDIPAHLALAEQVADAMWLLRQALIVLAGEFKKVTVYCSSGNHDRNVTRHKQRATSQKWDSYATHVYTGLKLALLHLPNITVNIPRTPYIEFAPFVGQRVYETHGDTNLDPGNPGKNVNIERLEAQMLRINNGEVKLKHEPYGLFVVGHVHVGTLEYTSAGVLITNGCLIPPDPFSMSLTYTATRNGQWLWETTPTRLVGDSRFLEVDESIDQDASLDKLIVPWNGEF